MEYGKLRSSVRNVVVNILSPGALRHNHVRARARHLAHSSDVAEKELIILLCPYFMVRMYPFTFNEDDILWGIIRKIGMTPDDVRTAVLAWAYTVARERDRDETWEKLNEAYRAFHRVGINVDRERMKDMYHLE